MTGLRLAVLAAALTGSLCTAPGPVAAQSKLPWKDANPLEGVSGNRKAQPRKAERTAAPASALPAAPASAAEATTEVVPVPDERPVQPGDRNASDMPAGDIPVPDARPPVPAPSASQAKVPASPESGAPATEPPPQVQVPAEAPNSPEKLKSRLPAISPETSVLAAAAVKDAELCEAELARRGAEFTVGDSISEGQCGVLRPVSVTKLSSGVKVSPRTQLLCRSALALDDWMKNSVVPAVRSDLPTETLAEFRHASTYVCRPRASETAISEHARGSAIDIAAFVFASGKEIGVEAQTPDSSEARFQADVRAGACGPFTTVLGPGTDADHATHFHLDIAARRGGSTYCR